MKILVIALFAFVLMGVVAPAQAEKQYTEAEAQVIIQQKLDKAWQTHRIDGVNQVVEATGMDSFNELQAIALWAQKKYDLAYARDARLGLLFADALAGMSKVYAQTRKKADVHATLTSGSQAFLSSQLIAFENVSRCADNSAGASYVALWQKGKAHGIYKKFLGGLPQEERLKIWEVAQNIANGRDVTKPDKAVCATGADVAAKAQTDKTCKADPENCDVTSFVELVDDNVWKTRREQVRALIQDRLEKGQI